MPNILFDLHGDSKDAFVSYSGKTGYQQNWGSVGDAIIPGPTSSGTSGVFGGKYIDLGTHGDGLCWAGFNSAPHNYNGFSVIMRIVPKTGQATPLASSIALLAVGMTNGYRMAFYLDSAASKLLARSWRPDGGALFTQGVFATAVSMTVGTPTEFMFSWDGVNPPQASQDGVSLGAYSGSVSIGLNNSAVQAVPFLFERIMIGGDEFGIGEGRTPPYWNELVIYDGPQSVTYSVRTGFAATVAIDGQQTSDPGIANVRTGTSYAIAGASLNGTCAVPSAANVKTGVATDNTTGTYTGSDRWSDPGFNHVETGVQYLANGVQQTGVMDEPNPANVRAGIVYDNNTKTGTLAVPAVNQVLAGIAVDNTTGTRDDAQPSDVSAGVVYAGGTKTGTKQTVTNLVTRATLVARGPAAALKAR
jgi:hypothetical protein